MKIKFIAAILSVSVLSAFSDYEIIPKSKVVPTEQPSSFCNSLFYIVTT